MTNVEQYLNQDKNTCVALPKKISACLQVDNFLSEYDTDEERELAMLNLLLLDKIPTEGSTKLVNSGDIFIALLNINNNLDNVSDNLSDFISDICNKTVFLKSNLPFGAQIIEGSSKYVVKYNFDLGGENIEIPDNCILEFDGGSVSNGTLVGNRTSIIASPVNIFRNNIIIDGTWDNGRSYSQWFNFGIGDTATDDDSRNVQNLMNFCGEIVLEKNRVFVLKSIMTESDIHPNLRGQIRLYSNTTIIGNGATFKLANGVLSDMSILTYNVNGTTVTAMGCNPNVHMFTTADTINGGYDIHSLTIYDVTFDGNAINNVFKFTQYDTEKRPAMLLRIGGGEHIVIERCQFKDCAGRNSLLLSHRRNVNSGAIEAEVLKDATIKDCIFKNGGAYISGYNNDDNLPINKCQNDFSFLYSDFDNTVVENCKFIQCDLDTHDFIAGRDWGGRRHLLIDDHLYDNYDGKRNEMKLLYTGGFEIHGSNSTCTHCMFIGCLPAMYIAIVDDSTNGTENVIISDNIITDCRRAIVFHRVPNASFKNISIFNNYIYSLGSPVQTVSIIHVEAFSTTETWYEVPMEDINIIGNTIRGEGTGIYLTQHLINCNISSNVFNVKGYPIDLQCIWGCKNVVISNNIMRIPNYTYSSQAIYIGYYRAQVNSVIPTVGITTNWEIKDITICDNSIEFGIPNEGYENIINKNIVFSGLGNISTNFDEVSYNISNINIYNNQYIRGKLSDSRLSDDELLRRGITLRNTIIKFDKENNLLLSHVDSYMFGLDYYAPDRAVRLNYYDNPYFEIDGKKPTGRFVQYSGPSGDNWSTFFAFSKVNTYTNYNDIIEHGGNDVKVILNGNGPSPVDGVFEAETYDGEDTYPYIIFGSTRDRDVGFHLYINGDAWLEYDGVLSGIKRIGTYAEKPKGIMLYKGFKYYCTDLNDGTEITYNGFNRAKSQDEWIEYDGVVVGTKRIGTTEERPTVGNASTDSMIYDGFAYFDTTINSLVFAKITVDDGGIRRGVQWITTELADKDYNPSDFSGFGKKYLRKNILDVYPDKRWVLKRVNNINYMLYTYNDKVYAVCNGTGNTGLVRTNGPVVKNDTSYNVNDIKDIIGNADNTINILDFDNDTLTVTLPDTTVVTKTELDAIEMPWIENLSTVRKNVLTADMLDKTNTIYVIQYDYDILGESITIPENCVFEFDGGSLNNGTLVGNGTKIISKCDSIFSAISIEGTWDCPYITSKWFKDVSNNNVLKQVFNLSSDDVYNIIVIEEGNYAVSITDTDDENHPILKIRSNTHLHVLGTINLAANDSTHYYIFYILHKDNITMDGGGTIIGDKKIHTGSTGEWGHGIYVKHGSNINISGLTIKDCWGDCLCIGDNNVIGICENVTVKDCTFINGRRQGVSVICAQNCSVEGCNISNIYGTSPSACIDIEPNTDAFCKNVIISNCILSGAYGIFITRKNIVEGGDCTLEDIFIRNNNIACIDISYTKNGNSETLAGDFAIRANCAQNLFITDNVITSVKEGINLSRNSFKSVVENNIIKTTGTAFYIEGPNPDYPYSVQKRYVSLTNNYIEYTFSVENPSLFIGLLYDSIFTNNRIVASNGGTMKISGGGGCVINDNQINVGNGLLYIIDASQIKNCKLDGSRMIVYPNQNKICKIDGCTIEIARVENDGLLYNNALHVYNSSIITSSDLFLAECFDSNIVCSKMVYVCGQIKHSVLTCPSIEFTGLTTRTVIPKENGEEGEVEIETTIDAINSNFSFNEVYFTKDNSSYNFTSPFRVEDNSQHTSIYNNTLTIGKYNGTNETKPEGYKSYDLLLSSSVSFNFYNNTITISSDSDYNPPNNVYGLLYIRTTNRVPGDLSDRGSYIEGNPVINISNNIVNNEKDGIEFSALFADIDERKIVVGNFLCPTEGPSNKRPKTVWTGAQFFDTDLGKFIYFKVVLNVTVTEVEGEEHTSYSYSYSWVDALGNSVDTSYITSINGSEGNVPQITSTGQLEDSGKAASNIPNANNN